MVAWAAVVVVVVLYNPLQIRLRPICRVTRQQQKKSFDPRRRRLRLNDVI
jgi:hypothetical protein